MYGLTRKFDSSIMIPLQYNNACIDVVMVWHGTLSGLPIKHSLQLQGQSASLINI